MSNQSKYGLFVIVALLTSSCDIAGKFWIETAILPHETVNVLGEWFRLVVTYNDGIFFGKVKLSVLTLSLLSGAAIVLLCTYTFRVQKPGGWFIFAMAMIVGGALGNFSDRFYRPGVLDFIDMGIGVHRWFVYNLADVFIMMGVGLLLVKSRDLEAA